jgi:hypothetical protein
MQSYFDNKTKKLFTCDVCWVVETEGLGVLHHARIGVMPGRPQKSAYHFSFLVYALSRTGAVNILEHNERRLRVYVASASVNFLSTVAEFIDP